jgi:hypothetical protein
MTRGKLIQELAEAGIILMGTDPRNLLGTLLFRLRERFVNIPGYGYWIAKRSYTPAGYDPNTWDKMTNEAVKKLRNRMRGAKSE